MKLDTNDCRKPSDAIERGMVRTAVIEIADKIIAAYVLECFWSPRLHGGVGVSVTLS